MINLNKTQTAQIGALLARSEPFILAEVRGYSIGLINYTSTKTGKAASFVSYKLNCESVGDDAMPVIIAIEVPPSATYRPASPGVEPALVDASGRVVPAPYKKGELVLFVVSHYQIEKGVTQIRAKAHTAFKQDASA